jgi:hypothetical protein
MAIRSISRRRGAVSCRNERENGRADYAVAANNDFSSPIPEHRESQLVPSGN